MCYWDSADNRIPDRPGMDQKIHPSQFSNQNRPVYGLFFPLTIVPQPTPWNGDSQCKTTNAAVAPEPASLTRKAAAGAVSSGMARRCVPLLR